jgi:hypothetical protein
MPWASVGTPDGGDGDVKTGINFYWTETFSGRYIGFFGRLEVFYWKLPVEDQNISDTQAPEELFLNPEDIDFLPMDVQDGEEDWTVLDAPTDD